MAPSQGLQACTTQENRTIVEYTSPEESIESLPPATPPSDLCCYGLAPATNDSPIVVSQPLCGVDFAAGGIASRVSESGYPSPPTTSSNPKHPVPLPGLSVVETTLPDEPRYDPYHDYPMQPSVYPGGILDSPSCGTWSDRKRYSTPSAPSQGSKASTEENRAIVKYTSSLSPPSLPPASSSALPLTHPPVLTLCGIHFAAGGIQSMPLESGYPSPPSTASNPKHPVPLPGFSFGEMTPPDEHHFDLSQVYPVQPSVYFGGIMDSPVASHRLGIVDVPPSTSSPLALCDSPHVPTTTGGSVFHVGEDEVLLSPLSPDYDTLPRHQLSSLLDGLDQEEDQFPINHFIFTEDDGPDLSPCSPFLSLNDSRHALTTTNGSAFHRREKEDLASLLSPEWDSKGHNDLPRHQASTQSFSAQLDGLDLEGGNQEDRFLMKLSAFNDNDDDDGANLCPWSPFVSPCDLPRGPSSTEFSASRHGESEDMLSPLSPGWDSNVLTQYDTLPSHQVSTMSFSSQLDRLDLEGGNQEDSFPVGLTTFTGDDDDNRPSGSNSRTKPVLPLLDIPGTNLGLRSYAPSPSSPMWLAEEYPLLSSVDVPPGDDSDYIVSPPSSGPPDTPSPSSPFLPLLDPDLDDEDEASDTFPKEGTSDSMPGYFLHPSSPSIRPLQFLPEFDDYQQHDYYGDDHDLLQSPSSLRSFTDLPDSDFSHHDAEGWPSSSPNPSPNPVSPITSDNLLLLLNDEDPNDTAVPSPRSPSPEYDFSADPSVFADFADHEEVQKLASLQKKAQNAEKVAREREQAAIAAALSAGSTATHSPSKEEGGLAVILPDDDVGSPSPSAGSVWQLQRAAAEARSVAKRERDRAREVGALLQLKLKERGVTVESIGSRGTAGRDGDEEMESSAPTPLDAGLETTDNSHSDRSPPLRPTQHIAVVKSTELPFTSPPLPNRFTKKPRMATIAQLVAKMFLNRHEAPSATAASTPSSPSPSGRSSSRYRSLWLRGLAAASAGGALGTGIGGMPHQPFLPYQQRYKFLRSSPLARSSVVAVDGTPPFDSNGGAGSGDVGGLLDDEEDGEQEGGFEALRTPITWGLDLQDFGDAQDGLLPAL